MRFKQFVGVGRDLEDAVNAWLAETEPDITQMVQTQLENGIALGFLYGESFRGQELRYAQEGGITGGLEPAVTTDQFPDKPLQVPMEP